MAPLSSESLIGPVVEAHRPAAAEHQVELRGEALPGGPTILGDRERLELVLGNLVANALKHTPAGGRVTVRLVADPGAPRFEVEDTGEGIAPEHQGRVFDRFFRVPGGTRKGSGLGLAIAREIVAAHGGTIGLRSEPGTGSVFYFSVPAAKA
jgi:signal transduction histidine kinase